nr:GGDEF domain-containing protein [Rhizobium sp. Q54]
METSNLIVYVPPVLFSLVAGCFFLLGRLGLSNTWYWGAGFAQTALGFVISTFSIQPTFDAFASGLIFMGASYCYGSGLLSHFKVPMQTTQRLTFVTLYTLALTYLVFVEKSLIFQLFLTDMAFAFLLGWAILRVRTQASSGIDKALVVTSFIVVLDSVSRATYFTFFTGSSNDFADFADSAYNLSVHLTTITVCMFFPFSALAAVGHTALERYQRAAETDELTGLLNRRGFRHAVERGDNAARHGSLIICDIDHFKGINDGYGHGFGDEVIRGLGEDLLQVIGPHGCTARYGGEEFVAFLPGVDVIKARDLAQSLRRAFAERAWVAFDVSERFTVSCGVASLRAEDTRLEAAVERADRALYAAKAAGRNRVFVDAADAQPRLHPAACERQGERLEA